MKMQPITIAEICMICGKMPQMAFYRPHSLHKTKRVVRPNLGKWQGLMVCAKCRKAMSKPEHIKKPRTTQPAETTI